MVNINEASGSKWMAEVGRDDESWGETITIIAKCKNEDKYWLH